MQGGSGPHEGPRDAQVPQWFHGLISRKASEMLLLCKPPGYFLVRVAESRNGFTLSYRATDRCRHFMIDTLRDGNYTITGECTRHRSLQDLVDFHTRTPLMPFDELLTVPCRQMSEDTETDEDVPAALLHSTSLPSFSTIPYFTDPTPNRFNSQLQDQALYFESQMVNAVQPTSSPSYTHMYNNKTEANQAPDIPAAAPGLRVSETNNNVLYPTLPSDPSTSGRAVSTAEPSAQQDGHADAKPSAMSNQMKLMALFRKNRGGPQKSPQSQLVDGGLPQEYLQPPPYAPGYC